MWTADWEEEYNTPDKQNTIIIFLTTIAVMQVIFWSKDLISSLFLVAEIHSIKNSESLQTRK